MKNNYNAALYIRETKEEKRIDKRKKVEEYLKVHDEIHIINEYIDDGNNDFNIRLELLENIKNNTIDTIITYDFNDVMLNIVHLLIGINIEQIDKKIKFITVKEKMNIKE